MRSMTKVTRQLWNTPHGVSLTLTSVPLRATLYLWQMKKKKLVFSTGNSWSSQTVSTSDILCITVLRSSHDRTSSASFSISRLTLQILPSYIAGYHRVSNANVLRVASQGAHQQLDSCRLYRILLSGSILYVLHSQPPCFDISPHLDRMR